MPAALALSRFRLRLANVARDLGDHPTARELTLRAIGWERPAIGGAS